MAKGKMEPEIRSDRFCNKQSLWSESQCLRRVSEQISVPSDLNISLDLLRFKTLIGAPYARQYGEGRADTAVTKSLIESVMIGLEGARTVSFTTSGGPISRYDE